MAKIAYINKRFSRASKLIIEKANDIIDEYAADNLKLTLRQLYYQFVSRDLIPNQQSEYKRLGTIVSDGRLAGLIDWEAIEDRTRDLKRNYHNTDPGDAVQDALSCFLLDKWEDQPYRPEVWIEKEALTGVIARICKQLDIPYFACKGYTSQSEMWKAAQRMKYYEENGQIPIIIHLGDHDPSGIDMTRDIDDRNRLFMGGLEVRRIALNMNQIEKYNPPPNPAKLTDTRASSYVDEFGYSSWELDALNPKIIRDLIKKTADSFTDFKTMKETIKREERYIKILETVVEDWETLV